MNNSSKIAINSFFLYLKMFFSVGVNLITSRIVLQQLGVEDFGIYSLIGGIVTLFVIMSNALISAMTRFQSLAVGKNDIEYGKKIYSSGFYSLVAISIFILFVGIILVLSNSISLLNIPIDRMASANWVFIFSLLSMCITIFSASSQSLLTARENMFWIFLVGIIELFLKICIVFSLQYTLINKLEYYSMALMLISVIIFVLFHIICRKKYTEARLIPISDWSTLKEMFTYSSWTILGFTASMVRNQGIPILLNKFLGITANAAFGIANQINSQLSLLSSALNRSFTPQITYRYSEKNYSEMFSLANKCSRYSFCITLLFSFPIIISLNYILTIWLGSNFPLQTIPISQMLILCSLSESISLGAILMIHATGKVKLYHIVLSFILMLNLPIIFLLLAIDCSIVLTLSALSVINLLAFIIRFLILNKYIEVDIKALIKQLLIPVLLLVFSFIIGYYIIYFFEFREFWKLVVAIVYSLFVIFFVGLTTIEREKIFILVKHIIQK